MRAILYESDSYSTVSHFTHCELRTSSIQFSIIVFDSRWHIFSSPFHFRERVVFTVLWLLTVSAEKGGNRNWKTLRLFFAGWLYLLHVSSRRMTWCIQSEKHTNLVQIIVLIKVLFKEYFNFIEDVDLKVYSI